MTDFELDQLILELLKCVKPSETSGAASINFGEMRRIIRAKFAPLTDPEESSGT